VNAYPPIALLPGLLCTAELWRDQIDFFENLPGDRPFVANFSRYDSIADMAKSVLDAMPEKFICLGLSMGGYVSLEIMRQAPKRVLGLGLLDTSARADTPERLKQRKLLLSMAKVGKFIGINDRLLPTLIHKDRLDDEPLTDRIKGMASDIGRDGFLAQQNAIINRSDSLPTLATINVPTLVVCGREDALTPLDHAQEIADGIGSNAELAVIDECGHLSTMEAPDAVNSRIVVWLKSSFSRQVTA